jgi:hypothetical protein
MVKNKLNIGKDIIDQMFIIAGHDLRYDDIVSRKDEWFQEYTMTEVQNKEWKNWGVNYLRKKKRYNKKIAEREMAWIDLFCGLKIKKINVNQDRS